MEEVPLQTEEPKKGLIGWVLASLFVHLLVGVPLLLISFSSQKLPALDVSYSVELVSGEKLGGVSIPGLAEKRRKLLEPVSAPKKPVPRKNAVVAKRRERQVEKPKMKIEEAKAQGPTAEIKRPKKPTDEEEGIAKLGDMKKRAQDAPYNSELPEQPAKEKRGPDPMAQREMKLGEALDKIREKVAERESQLRERDGKEREKRISQAVSRLSAVVKEKEILHGESLGAAKLGDASNGGTIVKSPEFIAYYSLIQRRIKEGWVWHGRKDLRATVRFGVMSSGEIVTPRVVEGSKDPAFDVSALRAVEKLSPLPPPPTDDFADILWTFQLED